jgi:hypothetical protein
MVHSPIFYGHICDCGFFSGYVPSTKSPRHGVTKPPYMVPRFTILNDKQESKVCWDRPSALAGIDHRLFCRSTVGSFADQPSARSPVTESTIERTNTRLVGPAHSLTSLNSLSCPREKKNSSNRGTPARKFFVSAAHQRTTQH